MTKLIYKIMKDGITITTVTTYAEAIRVKKVHNGSQIVSCYIPIVEKSNIFLTPKKESMRVKATV